VSETESPAPEPAATARAPRADWLLTAFLAYFLIIAGVVLLLILIAWNNGS
jgi:hypothetical protein